MTTTLIVLLIITLLAMIFLPFGRALMKDRAELHENPMEKKFDILITRINDLLMNGDGEVVKFKDDPRMLNLFDDNHANMIINFYYSTGSLTITLKYKYYHVELVKKMQFHDMRQAETFRQQDVANHFCEEASVAIRQHQVRINKERGLKDPAGEYIFSSQPSAEGSDNPVDLVRGMYDKFSHDEKLAWVNVAQMIYTADGSTADDFKNHPQFSDLLLNFQVNYSEAERQRSQIGESGIISVLDKGKEDDLMMKLMTVFPFVLDPTGPNEDRIETFYSIFGRLGFTQERIDSELEKMMLLMQHFGMS
ncbi:MAG: hypothetical protein K2O78_04455 [Muribaculaceae bacterium]|nr:hypothetical protein [Muribaculaceae bacterium]